MSRISKMLSPAADPRRSVGVVSLFQTWTDSREALPNDFATYCRDGYKDNGVVFAVVLARMLLLSEAEFAYKDKATKALSFDPGLELLGNPWPNGTTGELIARMEQDVSLGGNAYIQRVDKNRLKRLRPDLVDIVHNGEIVIGYVFYPEGRSSSKKEYLLERDVAHWSPIPDPESRFRGMSWLTPVAREIDADTLMNKHKGKFFKNAATPNLLVKVDGTLPDEDRDRMTDQLRLRQEGLENAYKTMLLEGGADATIIGSNFEQMAFSVTQAAGENRIAAAAGVPGIVVGLKEGLQAATYSNYGQAMRRFADITCRPLWRSMCGSLSKFASPPRGTKLWYADGDIPALKQDEKDRADVAFAKAKTADMLIRAGYEPDEVGKVADTGEGFDTLAHTGKIPTTLYKEGQDNPTTSLDNDDK